MARKRASLELAPIVAGLAAQLDDDEATTAMLDAAAQLLVTYGLRRWSIDDVADRAGVGRTSVYRKFGGRDELVHAVLARELRQTFTLISAAAASKQSFEDKVVAGALAALRALSGSVVDGVLRSDPATFLPFLTTNAGPLLDTARMILAPQISRAGLAVNAEHAAELAEAVARLGLSFVLTRESVFPTDERALERSVRRLLRPALVAAREPARH
jgi:AcrR family transcriptional regulator